MEHLSARTAAVLIGVSAATLRNWRRAGHLKAVGEPPLTFDRREVLDLRERIRSSQFDRLRRRANKSASDLVEVSGGSGELAHIGRAAADHGMDPANLLYFAALRLLEAVDEAGLPAAARAGRPFIPGAVSWRRKSVRKVMLAWGRRLAGPIMQPPDGGLDGIAGWNAGVDGLGRLYQAISSIGGRSRSGSYFTPAGIIDGSLAALGKAPASFLDPCCGTGRYLVRAAGRFNLDPERLYGFDSDATAVDIARLNLLLHYRDLDFVPRIECLDSLRDLANGRPGCATNPLIGAVDAIATNPPWGAHRPEMVRRAPGSLVRSGESFSLFLEKALCLLRDGGVLSFLLPEAVLEVKAHADVRELILEQAGIKKVFLLGKVFPGVFTSVIRLDLEKRAAPANWRLTVAGAGPRRRIPQRRFAANQDRVFDIGVSARDEELLGRIFSREHQTLLGHADWALGIVTGDNRRFLLDAPVGGAEPVVRGRDILPFGLRDPACFLKFIPEAFQQVAAESLYRAPEKLVYRFVATHPIFALDTRRLLTLNSANILIPRLSGLSVRAVLALLNSRVFRYAFSKRVRTSKILRRDLEALPFPLLSRRETRRLETLAGARLSEKGRELQKMEMFICRIFELDSLEVEYLQEAILSKTYRR